MKKQRIAVYPMSANTPTWGHADIMKRAAVHFDCLYWAAAVNPHKHYMFSQQERLEMMQIYVAHYQVHNVKLDTFSGSTVRYAQKIQAGVLIKGLRTESDFNVELQQAVGNKGIDEQIETFCLLGTPELSVVSSTLVRELALLGEKIERYVHPQVAERIYRAIQSKRS